MYLHGFDVNRLELNVSREPSIQHQCVASTYLIGVVSDNASLTMHLIEVPVRFGDMQVAERPAAVVEAVLRAARLHVDAATQSHRRRPTDDRGGRYSAQRFDHSRLVFCKPAPQKMVTFVAR